MELTEEMKTRAKSLGADLVGVCSIESMGLSEEQLAELYPGVESVMVFARRHSSGALEASNRRAGVEVGLGTLGLSNILITREFGPRIRLGGVLTSAKLQSDEKMKENLCIPGCRRCIETCPAKALKEGEKTNVHDCGMQVFQFGMRSAVYYIREQLKKPKEEAFNTFVTPTFMNLWQTLCIGVYYTCFECQRVCPVGTWRKQLIGCNLEEA